MAKERHVVYYSSSAVRMFADLRSVNILCKVLYFSLV